MDPISPLSYLHSFFSLFPPLLLSLNAFHCPVFSSLILSFMSSGLLLNSSIELLYFSTLISVWYLLTFFICWISHFVHALFSWPWWASLWPLFLTLLSKLLISVSLTFFFLEILFFCLKHSYFFNSLILCVGFCVLDKTATYPSLDRVVSCRRWTLLFSLDWAGGCPICLLCS